MPRRTSCSWPSASLRPATVGRRSASTSRRDRGSRFAPGVSVLLAAFDEERASRCGPITELEYEEFEVIVVNDGSTDATLDRLLDVLDLVPVEEMSRDVVETEPILAYYRSEREPPPHRSTRQTAGRPTSTPALNHARYATCAGSAPTWSSPRPSSRAMPHISAASDDHRPDELRRDPAGGSVTRALGR